VRIAVTGVSGLIGQALWPVLSEKHEAWALGRRKPDCVPFNRWRTTDIIDPENTAEAVEKLNPDCLIHLAAVSNPDACEADPETGYRANSLGTRNLALACMKFDTELLYVSTDQVFDGKKRSPYTELDRPNPVNHYGLSKLWGEDFVRGLLRRHYVVRTALVFGPSRPTFVDRVARAVVSGEPVTAAADLVNSPTYSRDLARAISYLAESRLYGTYHIANEGSCDRYTLARFIADTAGQPGRSIRKGTKKSLKLPAARPSRTPLENFVWNLNGFPRLRPWREAVVEHLQQLPG